jgi:hypothetical protein
MRGQPITPRLLPKRRKHRITNIVRSALLETRNDLLRSLRRLRPAARTRLGMLRVTGRRPAGGGPAPKQRGGVVAFGTGLPPVVPRWRTGYWRALCGKQRRQSNLVPHDLFGIGIRRLDRSYPMH